MGIHTIAYTAEISQIKIRKSEVKEKQNMSLFGVVSTHILHREDSDLHQ